ncbi:MAG: GAF domain-containing protein, partial [Saprospiraceae bacterium]|nr:GAF domain-containing protein [Saprospiraceae bacterium]
MDKYDALGPRPDRHRVFNRELLSEAKDDKLESIVREAARDLGTPIALVNLVLEEIQFFKAHYGLPEDLAAARGTDRDVSFCQFVVRDGEPFVVQDAEQDDRVPQHLVKEYGIRAYLGMPIMARDTIVGSICVLDTKPRDFSESDRQNLMKLASIVNERLEDMSRKREKRGTFLIEETTLPVLESLRQSLLPIQKEVSSGRMATASIGSFLRMARHALSGRDTSREALINTLEVAREALRNCLDSFYNIEASAGDAEDSLSALE